jgi:hypothetical protein
MNYDGASEANISAYRLLYIIEVGLREFISAALEAQYGVRWWEKNSPVDLRDAMRTGKSYERSVPWIQVAPQHPIYYLDFPDLRKLIELTNNWKGSFAPFFGRKEVATSTLIELEPIRNKVAHNRRITPADLYILQSAYEKLENCITPYSLLNLVKDVSDAPDVSQALASLLEEAQTAHQLCSCFGPLTSLPAWTQAANSWWFDRDYLLHPIHDTTAFFTAIQHYIALPRRKGAGHLIERWVQENDFSSLADAAISELRSILDSR